jgi:hypothetical protein
MEEWNLLPWVLWGLCHFSRFLRVLVKVPYFTASGPAFLERVHVTVFFCLCRVDSCVVDDLFVKLLFVHLHLVLVLALKLHRQLSIRLVNRAC